MNSKNYFITLRPLGPFFFGGQKRSEAETETDYYLKSRYFPQQTAVLGMLRHELLMQNGVFPLNSENREKAAHLIGESSFKADAEKQTFGVIKEISPLFLVCGKGYCHIAPRDHGLILAGDRDHLYFEDFKPKEYKHPQLLANDGTMQTLEMDKLFKVHEQVGIKKGERGQTEEEGFYKQLFYRFEKGVCLGFYLRLDQQWGNKAKTILNTNMVFMGGERSGFKMVVTEKKEIQKEASVKLLYDRTLPPFASISRNKEYTRIILTSDAFIDAGVYERCVLAVSHSVFFRNIRSHVKHTSRFNNLARTGNPDKTPGASPYLSCRYNLMSRGSVLYCLPSEAEAVCNAIGNEKEESHYRNTGYNYYIKVDPSNDGGLED